MTGKIYCTVFLFCIAQCGMVCAVSICKNVHKETEEDKYFEGYTYEEIPSLGFQQCLAECQKRQECKSLNYITGHMSCALNTETVMNTSILTSRKGSLFKDMNVSTTDIQLYGCQKDTCPLYYRCIDLSSGDTICVEPIPTFTMTSTNTKPSTTTKTVLYRNDTSTTSTSESTTTTTISANSELPLACIQPYTYNVATSLCLYVIAVELNQTIASMACAKKNGRLIVAETTSKQSAIANLVPSASSTFWVGATWDNDVSTYRWEDGTEVIESLEGSGDCVCIRGDGALLKGNCSTISGFICEGL